MSGYLLLPVTVRAVLPATFIQARYTYPSPPPPPAAATTTTRPPSLSPLSASVRPFVAFLAALSRAYVAHTRVRLRHLASVPCRRCAASGGCEPDVRAG